MFNVNRCFLCVLVITAQFLSITGTDVTKFDFFLSVLSPSSLIHSLIVLFFFQTLCLEQRFALRVWTYQKSSSVTAYGLITFFVETPSILFSPFAGVLIDRLDRTNTSNNSNRRKLLMVFSDTVSCLTSLVLYRLFIEQQLQTWHILTASAIASVMNSLQWTCLTASTSMMVPREKLTKYNGITEGVTALSMLIAPSIAGYVMSSSSARDQESALEHIFLFEFVSFVAATVITLCFTTIPSPSSSSSKEEQPQQQLSVLQDMKQALSFILSHRGLTSLLLILITGQYSVGITQVLMTPVILNMPSSTPKTLGMVLTLSGLGAMAGMTFLALVKPKPTTKKSDEGEGDGSPTTTPTPSPPVSPLAISNVKAVLACAFIQSFLLLLCGVARTAMPILCVAFTYMAVTMVSRAARTTIWQLKTPLSMQVRTRCSHSADISQLTKSNTSREECLDSKSH